VWVQRLQEGKTLKTTIAKKLTCFLISQLLLSTVCIAQQWAPEWRQLVPLKSTRAEVDKILGKPDQSFDSYALYRTPKGRFSVWYSLGGCKQKIEGRQWDVAKGLMTSLSVYVDEGWPLTKYVQNPSDFRRTVMPYNRVLYASSDESLIFETINPGDREEWVSMIAVDPTKEQDKLLLCR
jgi:hypothetical protein